MDLNFDEGQQILSETARKFFEKEVPKTLIRELLVDEKGYSPEIWKKMSELGWIGLAFDEKYGGYGGKFIDIAIIFEEMGRAVMPSPFFTTVILSGLLIQEFASDEIKNEIIPKIVEGEYISTLALTGKTGLYSKNEITLEANPTGNGYLLNGSSFFVPYAHVADKIICAAKMPQKEEVSLFIVDGKAKGLEALQLKTINGDGIDCVVNMKDVEVASDQIIGEIGKGWECIENHWPKIATALSCECVGGMSQVVEMTVQYVNERIQFGKPLGTLQAIQHICADMHMKSETSRYAAYYAAWNVSEGLECKNDSAIAKSWCGGSYKDVTKLAHQVTGGIGFTEEYDLQLFSRNAKKLELFFGDVSFHRSIVADNLGL